MKLTKPLLTGLPFEGVIGDKGYDSKVQVGEVEDHWGKAVVPNRSNATTGKTDWTQNKDRNLIERFWLNEKQFRRVVTRFDKKAQNFLALVHLASIMILLR